MKYLLTAILLLVAVRVEGAELLVQAKDSLYETGAKKGDVIIVRPDGWVWGKEEGLPNYMVVKLKGVPVEDVKHYEEQLTEQVEVPVENGGNLVGGNLSKEYRSKIVRLRKYSVPVADVETARLTAVSVKEIGSKDVVKYPIRTKDLAVEKVAIAQVEAIKEAEILIERGGDVEAVK